MFMEIWSIVFSIIGGLGIGTLFTRIIDIIWFQRIAISRERKKWIFEKKYEAYTQIIKEIRYLSGLGQGQKKIVLIY